MHSSTELNTPPGLTPFEVIRFSDITPHQDVPRNVTDVKIVDDPDNKWR